MWRLPALTIVVGEGGILLFAAYWFGPPTLLAGLILFWPAFVLAIALTVLALSFFELAVEPRRLEISENGISFGGRFGRQTWAWSQLSGPDTSVLGVLLRRKPLAVPSLPSLLRRLEFGKGGGPRPGILPSPNQWRAILAHPSCPRWELSDRMRRRMGINPVVTGR